MTPAVTPTVTFFNNKGGVGKTTLVYHLAWMLSELDVPVLAVDLDPQANLTSVLLDDDRVEALWCDGDRSIFGALRPLLEGEGGVGVATVEEVTTNLHLVPGDLLLSGAEQELSAQWPNAVDGQPRAFRVESAFAQVIKSAAEAVGAQVVLVDVGPNLGAINRAAMVATDHVVVPLSPDLYSLQGLRNLGPTLERWRGEWQDRLERKPSSMDWWLPSGSMQPAGYVVLQHGVRLDRVVGAYDRWLRRIPGEYRASVLQEDATDAGAVEGDPQCLGLLKHYHSLAPMAQEARKPVFLLRSADGAIGAHQRSVQDAYGHFEQLGARILRKVGLGGLVPERAGTGGVPS